MKESIIKYLEGHLQYEDTDDIYIDELVFNLDIIKQCKKDMKDGDKIKLTSNITRNEHKENFLQRNRLLTVYNEALKNVLNLSKQLGLSPVDRKKLKMMEMESPDDLTKLQKLHEVQNAI